MALAPIALQVTPRWLVSLNQGEGAPVMSLVVAMLVALSVFAAVLMFIVVYNDLVTLRRRCDQARSDIDAQLKHRLDLVPNLVEAAKGYAAHEKGTLEAVTKACNAVAAAPTSEAGAQAQALLGASLGRLISVAQANPELKASERFVELSDLETKIAAARLYLHNAVAEYNTAIEQFPGNLFAALFGFAIRSFDEADDVVPLPEWPWGRAPW
jgi:LemA protein